MACVRSVRVLSHVCPRFNGLLSARGATRPFSSMAAAKDKLLFTPGPLLTSPTVKQAMLRDLGSRDVAFINVIKEVRSGVLKLAGVDPKQFTMVPVQGSGTFGVEATLSTAVPRNGSVLIVANGAYGQRMEKICKAAGIKHRLLLYPDDTAPSAVDIERCLSEMGSECTHVAMVHSETTSGIINDIHSVGSVPFLCARVYMRARVLECT